jgi:hypothetical protein
MPPKLTDALTLPTSSRSANGFKTFQSFFFPEGLAEVEKVSPSGGYTFFIPIDDAFGALDAVKETHVSAYIRCI